MAQPYIGEIRMFAGNFAPAGWAFCDGSIVPISENETLFTLIGTTYGGDGETTFALPNLQSRVPIHLGTGPDGTSYSLGQMAGTEQETLTVQQIPQHTHPLMASNDLATLTTAGGNVLATPSSATVFPYGTDMPPATLNPQAITPAGSSQPHDNTQPFLCINFIISLFGIFPQPT